MKKSGGGGERGDVFKEGGGRERRRRRKRLPTYMERSIVGGGRVVSHQGAKLESSEGVLFGDETSLSRGRRRTHTTHTSFAILYRTKKRTSFRSHIKKEGDKSSVAIRRRKREKRESLLKLPKQVMETCCARKSPPPALTIY